MKKVTTLVFALAVLMISGMIAGPAFGQTAMAPYKLTLFASAPTGSSAPDSIAVLDSHVFVGYGDGHLPDGSDGLSNQIVEYKMDGSVVRTYTMVGHNDGLKVDPVTHLVTAKHGQSPIDPNRFVGIPGTSGTNGQSPSTVIASLLPDPEVNQIGPTEDDLSLLWLADSSQTSNRGHSLGLFYATPGAPLPLRLLL
jgi:hypothetical protein